MMRANTTMLGSIPKYHGQYSIGLRRPGMQPMPVWVCFDKGNLVLRAAMPHFDGVGEPGLLSRFDAIICELGLDPEADPNRREPAPGDVRIAVFNLGKAVVSVHQPAARNEQGRAKTLRDGTVTVEPFESETGGGVTVTAIIPWREIASRPPQFALDMVIPGDAGVSVLRADGSGVADRIMWANPVPVVLGDMASETRLAPHLWGRFKVEKIKN